MESLAEILRSGIIDYPKSGLLEATNFAKSFHYNGDDLLYQNGVNKTYFGCNVYRVTMQGFEKQEIAAFVFDRLSSLIVRFRDGAAFDLASNI